MGDGKTKIYNTKKGCKTSSTRASRSNISKRRPVNRYLAEADSAGGSTSAKKLKLSKDNYDINVNASFSYRFIDFQTVFSIISQLVVCKNCGTNIMFSESSIRGLGFKIVVACKECKPTYINSSPIIDCHAYDINRSIILAMRLLGVGLNGIIKFCAFVELPRPVFQSYYNKIIKTISIATATVREKCMKKAAIEEKKIERRKRNNRRNYSIRRWVLEKKRIFLFVSNNNTYWMAHW